EVGGDAGNAGRARQGSVEDGTGDGDGQKGPVFERLKEEARPEGAAPARPLRAGWARGGEHGNSPVGDGNPKVPEQGLRTISPGLQSSATPFQRRGRGQWGSPTRLPASEPARFPRRRWEGMAGVRAQGLGNKEK